MKKGLFLLGSLVLTGTARASVLTDMTPFWTENVILEFVLTI